MTLPPQTQAAIYRLLDQGLNYTQVSKRLGIGRSTVRLYDQRRRGRAQTVRKRPEPKMEFATGPVRYCEGCRHYVKTPCLACYLRKRAAEEKP